MAYRRWTYEEASLAKKLHEEGDNYGQIAARLNVQFGTERTAEKVRDGLRKGAIEAAIKRVPDDIGMRTERVKVTRVEGGSDTVLSNRPFSPDEMAEMFGIDQEEYEAGKVVTNTWGDNWQTKVDWRQNFRNVTAKRWDDMLAEIEKQGPMIPEPPPKRSSGTCYEICMFDAHLGMLGWGPEVGQDSDLLLEAQRFVNAFQSLMQRRPERIERFVFPVGNDFFHFDTMMEGKGGATTRGTPQDVDTRYQKLFVVGAQILQHCIEEMAKIAPVDVIVVQGNHDEMTMFYMGEWLKATFSQDRHVTVDNTAQPRKYFNFGTVGLGYTHGHLEAKGALANLMQEEAPEVWHNSRIREWHTGHLHFEQLVQAAKAGTRIVVRQMPAMCLHDVWHRQKGYMNSVGARGFVWDRAMGLLNIIVYDMAMVVDPDEHIVGSQIIR